MGTRAIIDTNVIISAFGWDGVPEDLLVLAAEGSITLVCSYQQLEEISRVMGYPHLRRLALRKSEHLGNLEELCETIDAPVHEYIIKDDPSDDIILAAAIAGAADVIISGDKHLLSLGNHKGIPIMTPAAFLATRR